MQTLVRVVPGQEPEHAGILCPSEDRAIERLVEYVEQERYLTAFF